jgi:MoaE-MoaD fusion protein
MNITVLLFATLKDHAGMNRLTVQLPSSSATLKELRAALTVERPRLSDLLPSAVAAINQEFAFADDPIREGDEVAFFPPVSGGQAAWPETFQIASAPIDLNELTRNITTPFTGAVCLFTGTVRGQTVGNGDLLETTQLEYEAYEPMAIAKMRQIATEIRAQWPLVQGLAMVQRIGKLEVSEPTVLIACGAAHRDQGCFEAARYGIDRLKEIVPVWKKEIRSDGSEWVEGHYTPTQDDRNTATPG